MQIEGRTRRSHRISRHGVATRRRFGVSGALVAILGLVGGLLVATLTMAAPAFAACADNDHNPANPADCAATMTLTKHLAPGQTDGDTAAGHAPILLGDEVRYELKFQCSSLLVDCGTLTIIDTLDPRLDFVNASASITKGALQFAAPTTTTDPVTGAITVTMVGAPFDAGDSGSVFLTTRVKSGADTSIPISNGASAFSTSTVNVVAPNDVEIDVQPGTPDWQLNKTNQSTQGGAVITTGQIVGYTLTLFTPTERGNLAVTGGTVVDHFPIGAEVIDASGNVIPDGGMTPASGPFPGGVVDTAAGTITFTVPPRAVIANGAEWSQSVRLRFTEPTFTPDDPATPQNEGTPVANYATITLDFSDGSTVTDGPTGGIGNPGGPGTICRGTSGGNPSYSGCIAATTLGPKVTQVGASKSKVGGQTAIAGQPLIYNVGVTVAGSNQPVGGVVVRDTIPAGMDIHSITYRQGTTLPSWVMEYSTDGGTTWISFNTLDADSTNDALPSWQTGQSAFDGSNSWPQTPTYPFNKLGNVALTQAQWDVLNDPTNHVTDIRMRLLGDLPVGAGSFGFELQTQINNDADVPGQTTYSNCIEVTAGADVRVYSQGQQAAAAVQGGTGTACATALSTTEYVQIAVGKQAIPPPGATLAPGATVPWLVGVSNASQSIAGADEYVIADLLPKGLSYVSTDCWNRNQPITVSSVTTNNLSGWRCNQNAWDTGIGTTLSWMSFGAPYGTSQVTPIPSGTPANTSESVPQPDIAIVTVNGEQRQLLTWTLPMTSTALATHTLLFRTVVDPDTAVGPLVNQAVVVSPTTPTLCATGGTQVIPGTDEQVATPGGYSTSVASQELATQLGLDGDNPGCLNSASINVVGNAFVSAEKWVSGTNGLPDVWVGVDDPTAANFGAEAEVPAKGVPAASDLCPVQQLPTDVGIAQTFTRFPCVGQVVPNGEFQYRWILQNTGTAPLHNYVIYDVLPYVGDTGVSQSLAGQSRDSEWTPIVKTPLVPLDPVTGQPYPAADFSTSIQGLPAGADPIATYSKSRNPCRPELNAGPDDADWQGANCDAADTPEGKFYLSIEIDAGVDGMTWAQVGSLRVEMFWAEADQTEWTTVAAGQTVTLPVDGDGDGVPGGLAVWRPGDLIIAEMTMQLPVNAPGSVRDDPKTPGNEADDPTTPFEETFAPSATWNSVAHRVFRINEDGSTTRQLAAEPQKVGTITSYGSFPDIDIEKYSSATPWNYADDANDADGLGADGQPNSVPEDFDTTAKRIPAGQDQQLRFTVTNTGTEDLTDMTLVDKTNVAASQRDTVLQNISCDLSAYYDDAAHRTWDFSSPAFSLADHDAGIIFAPGHAFDCTATLPGLAVGATHSDTVRVDALGWPSQSPVDDADDWNAEAATASDVTPSIEIEKYSGNRWSYDAERPDAQPDGDFDSAPGASVEPGKPAPVTMTITNTGFEPLIDVVVTDRTGAGPAVTGLTCDFSALGGPRSGASWSGPFQPGDSFDCAATLPGMDAGVGHADTAAVTATGQTSGIGVADDDAWHAHAAPHQAIVAPAEPVAPPNGPHVHTGGTPSTAGGTPWGTAPAGVLAALLALAGALTLWLARRRRAEDQL